MRRLSINHSLIGHFSAVIIMTAVFFVAAADVNVEIIPQNLSAWGIFFFYMIVAEVFHELLHVFPIAIVTRNFNSFKMHVKPIIGSCYEIIQPISKNLFIFSLLTPFLISVALFFIINSSDYWRLFFMLNIFGCYYDLVLIFDLIKINNVKSVTSTVDEGTVVLVP